MSTGLRLLRLLLDATRAGKLRWSRTITNPDLYEAHLGEERITARFVRFVRTDKGTSDRHLVELEAFGVSTDHAVGTEGFEMVMQMIAMHDAQLRGVRNAIRQRISEAEDAMADLMEQDAPPVSNPARRVRMPTAQARAVRMTGRR